MVPQVQERQLRALLPQDNDERVEHVDVLAEEVQPDGVANGRRVPDANAPDATAERCANGERDVQVDQHLARVVRQQQRPRQQHLLVPAHRSDEAPDEAEVGGCSEQRHAREVVPDCAKELIQLRRGGRAAERRRRLRHDPRRHRHATSTYVARRFLLSGGVPNPRC